MPLPHIILHIFESSCISYRITGFDIEELAVDISYWFDKSTKRKARLEEFCVFCNTAYKEVVSRISTRWLSLEQAITRILELFISLTSYFISISEPRVPACLN